MTPDGDHIVSFDAEQIEDINENIELFTAIETKINSGKESQVGECDKLKLKVFSMTVLVRRFI